MGAKNPLGLQEDDKQVTGVNTKKTPEQTPNLLHASHNTCVKPSEAWVYSKPVFCRLHTPLIPAVLCFNAPLSFSFQAEKTVKHNQLA